MTPIAIPIFVHDLAQTAAAMQAAVDAGAGMVELRCDTAPLELIEAAIRARDGVRLRPGLDRLPVIVTIRPTWEGGHYDGDDQERLALFEHAGLAGADYIDVELVAWQRSANLRQKVMLVCRHPQGKDDGGRERGSKLILSSHDFAGRPADLHARLAAMRQVEQASVLKLVWQASSVADAAEALSLTHAHALVDSRPLLALAMGPFGQISRILGAKYRQPFTFATLPGDAGSAPGQPSIVDLLTTYRFNEQTPESPVYGVIGWPVGHSLSPHIHNAGFAALGLPGVYVPLPIVEPYEAFAAGVDALRGAAGIGLRGLSVTIPHKENALRYVRERGGTVDELSGHIGVVNTIVFGEGVGGEGGEGSGVSVRGLNSDYAGALDALVGAMGGGGRRREDLAGMRVAVLGAGGAARAIVAGLAHYNATVVIYNRTLERAQALAADFNGTPGKVVAAAWEHLCRSCCQAIINCTPIGMHPKVDASPVPAEFAFVPGTTVFDTVYNPLETRLLKQAKEQGATTVTGMEMFVRQAAIQFKAFTGEEAPVEVFRGVMGERLG